MKYLPEQLTEDEIEAIVKETINETESKFGRDIGKVMKAVLPKVKGRADGKLVNQLSENILAKTRKLDKRSSFFYISFLTGNFHIYFI